MAKIGNTNGFKKGMTPWNKGKHVRLNPKGEFKKGQLPYNTGSRKKRINCTCIVCDKHFEEFASGIKEGRGKFCSRICWRKGHTAWNKGKAGPREELSPLWKGDQVGYFGLHEWVRRQKGKPIECEFCLRTEEETRMEWANISGKYKREIDDYMALCAKCHRNYDKNYEKRSRDKSGRFI
jgi:hypothetical protein